LKVGNLHESAEQELAARSVFTSEITDLIDWLNAASVKVQCAPAVDCGVDEETVQRLVSEHEVELPNFL